MDIETQQTQQQQSDPPVPMDVDQPGDTPEETLPTMEFPPA